MKKEKAFKKDGRLVKMDLKARERKHWKMNKRGIATAVIAAVFLFAANPAMAAEVDALVLINNTTRVILNIISAVGVIVAAWGGVQLAIALHQQEPTGKTQAALILAAGAILIGISSFLRSIGLSV